MRPLYDSGALRKPTNLSINSDLLKQARRRKINLSATLEEALAELLRAQQLDAWREDNAAAIKAYNEHVDRHGTFSDSVRKF